MFFGILIVIVIFIFFASMFKWAGGDRAYATEGADVNRFNLETDVNHLLEKHSGVVDIFYEVASRKAIRRDDYGDERIEDGKLSRLSVECALRICEREGITTYRHFVGQDGAFELSFDPRDYRDKLGTAPIFGTLMSKLKDGFNVYRERVRANAGSSYQLGEMTGIGFEAHVAAILARCGHTDIRTTAVTGDQGADLLTRWKGRLLVIQVKRRSSPIGNDAVQEVVAARGYYSADEAWVVTNSIFTKAAIALAAANGVQLVDGAGLARLESLSPALGIADPS